MSSILFSRPISPTYLTYSLQKFLGKNHRVMKNEGKVFSCFFFCAFRTFFQAYSQQIAKILHLFSLLLHICSLPVLYNVKQSWRDTTALCHIIYVWKDGRSHICNWLKPTLVLFIFKGEGLHFARTWVLGKLLKVTSGSLN